MNSDLNNLHAVLMRKWKSKPSHHGHVFIEDGIIDIDKWSVSNKKILVLLKEAYGGDSDWSLVEAIRNDWQGPKYKVFWTISYWLYLLQNITSDDIPLFPSSEHEYQECREYLLSSAIVNLKKSAGSGRSNDDNMIEYIKEDAELLREQVEIIAPDIILCGYTKEYFELFWKNKIEAVKNTELIFRSNDMTIIDFWHPSNMYPEILCYYAIGALYQKTL